MLLQLVPALAQNQDYVTLRKFLSARMYGEAYMELLRNELARDEFDPKLEKLKSDLLERTEKRLLKQAKINPDDPAIFTILADINFHSGKLDQAAKFADQALKNRSGPLANYVFAKILFKRGNISQAFDQMGNVLEAMPDSPVVFADFQFLYSCKSYGVATAKKIVKNTNFLKRATPIAGDSNIAEIPESPFENDPTTPPEVIPAPGDGTDVADLPDDISGATIDNPDSTSDQPIDDAPLPDENQISDLPDLPDQPGDDFPDIERPVPMAGIGDGEEPDSPQQPEPVKEDPEKESIKKAEYWLEQANKQFANRNYDDAKLNLEKALELYPGVTGKDETKAKLEAKFDLFKRYKEARALFDQEKYEQALPTIEEAYAEEPARFKEAPFYIGKIYLLKPEPERETALKFLDIVLKDENLDPLFRRDIEWTKLEILYELERYEDANLIFKQFEEKELDFAKNQSDYRELKYGIWYQLNKFWVHVGLGIMGLLFMIVFILQLLPAITLAFLKPENVARRSFEKGNFNKAASMAEKALGKKQPVQIEREMLEILVKSHFEMRNFVKCQDFAKEILEKFPGNHIAWGYLAKASIACNDSSSEAIAMYEAIYRENPENAEYLQILARHYAKTKNYTVEAMGILFTYYQTGTDEPEIVLGMAEGYVQNRSMGNEVIAILEEALKHQDRIEFRELLARNYAKAGRYADASRECLRVLDENLNNMGIHVVYSSSMKKLNMLDEAVKQYESFLQRSPGNAQLTEILTGLKKDVSVSHSTNNEASDESFHELPDELPMDELPAPDLAMPQFSPEEIDIEGFVEPPPEGFAIDEEASIPLPDFLKNEPPPAIDSDSLADMAIEPGELPELDPFAESDSLLDEFATELPEELGGPGNSVSGAPVDLSSYAADPTDLAAEPAPPAKARKETSEGSFAQISKARELSGRKKWQEVIELLNPIYASERNQEVGLLLANALLETKEAIMAMEIIETLDIDPELMSDQIKDVLYRTGLALESTKKYDEALRMYDLICGVDINYRDAFDRSDKIYSQKKG